MRAVLCSSLTYHRLNERKKEVEEETRMPFALYHDEGVVISYITRIYLCRWYFCTNFLSQWQWVCVSREWKMGLSRRSAGRMGRPTNSKHRWINNVQIVRRSFWCRPRKNNSNREWDTTQNIINRLNRTFSIKSVSFLVLLRAGLLLGPSHTETAETNGRCQLEPHAVR